MVEEYGQQHVASRGAQDADDTKTASPAKQAKRSLSSGDGDHGNIDDDHSKRKKLVEADVDARGVSVDSHLFQEHQNQASKKNTNKNSNCSNVDDQNNNHTKYSNNNNHNDASLPEAERRYRPQKFCAVCGDKAIACNFNAVTCESCKAFFRRNAFKESQLKCLFEKRCVIDRVTRRFCSKCRLLKCFSIGMKREWILTDEQKHNKRVKIMQNKQSRRGTHRPPPEASFRCGDDTTNRSSSSNNDGLHQMGGEANAEFTMEGQTSDANQSDVDGGAKLYSVERVQSSRAHRRRVETRDAATSCSGDEFDSNNGQHYCSFASQCQFCSTLVSNGVASISAIYPISFSHQSGPQVQQAPPVLNYLPAQHQPVLQAAQHHQYPHQQQPHLHSHPQQQQHHQQQHHQQQQQQQHPIHHHHHYVASPAGSASTTTTTTNPNSASNAGQSAQTSNTCYAMHSPQMVQRAPPSTSTSCCCLGPSSQQSAQQYAPGCNQHHSAHLDGQHPQLHVLRPAQSAVNLSASDELQAGGTQTVDYNKETGNNYNPFVMALEARNIWDSSTTSSAGGQDLSPSDSVQMTPAGEPGEVGNNGDESLISNSAEEIRKTAPEVDTRQPQQQQQQVVDQTADNHAEVVGSSTSSEPINSELTNYIVWQGEIFKRPATEEAELKRRVEALNFNDSERHLIDEMLEATKFLFEPSTEGRSNPPSNLDDLVLFCDVALRKLIKTVKQIKAFRILSMDDQIMLLKTACFKVLLLRSTFHFREEIQGWQDCKTGTRMSLEILKASKRSLVYQRHREMITKISQPLRKDRMVMSIMSMALLFDSSINLKHSKSVGLDNLIYLSIMRKYLVATQPDPLAKYERLVGALQAVNACNDEYNVFFSKDFQPEQMTPLLIEIFDISINNSM